MGIEKNDPVCQISTQENAGRQITITLLRDGVSKPFSNRELIHKFRQLRPRKKRKTQYESRVPHSTPRTDSRSPLAALSFHGHMRSCSVPGVVFSNSTSWYRVEGAQTCTVEGLFAACVGSASHRPRKSSSCGQGRVYYC